MSMDLDRRQRAMLREMGVRVWQPSALRAPAPAGDPGHQAPPPAAHALHVETRRPAVVPTPLPTASPAARPVPPPSATAATRSLTPAEPGTALWSVGEALSLYGAAEGAAGPRWLVLAETPAAAVQAGAFDPFAGDAGRLLDNMLRAARLHQAGAVLLAPLVRHTLAEAVSANLGVALPGLLASARPDVVLVMGRLAAQALLQSSEPFGRLRGQVHRWHGLPTVLTHDAAYLLRMPADKGKAWDDLCLAMGVAAAPPG
ncbi:MAG: uracil-DNA glycosylase [Polaromonas sp.]|nr:uracil-DNA glycosylase [Polaromonas sp.]